MRTRTLYSARRCRCEFPPLYRRLRRDNRTFRLILEYQSITGPNSVTTVESSTRVTHHTPWSLTKGYRLFFQRRVTAKRTMGESRLLFVDGAHRAGSRDYREDTGTIYL
jgi:hypothetical protein